MCICRWTDVRLPFREKKRGTLREDWSCSKWMMSWKGGDEEHEHIMADIASKITFGKLKEVRQFDERVLFNGRRWFLDGKRWGIKFQVTDYIRNRIGPVNVVKSRKQKADQPQLTTLEVRTAEPAWCCRTTLPPGTQWHEVVRRQVCDLEGNEIEPWLEVSGATTDELHRPLVDSGVEPQRILIRYQVDQDRQKLAKRLLNEEEQTQLRGSVAGLNWAARQGRPDAASAASS